MKKVIILGGIGNGSVIANAILHANNIGYNEWQVVGFLNDREEKGSSIEGFPILGKLSDVRKFIEQDYYFINTIYRIDGQNERLELFEAMRIPDERLATFVHPSAYVAPSVVLGPGTVVMPQVSLSSGSVYGRGCLIMVAATVGHNNEIGDYCHIAAQACVGSYLKIGKGVHIGLNATIRENLIIGEGATVGMGAVLLKNVPAGEIWAGNPAKFIRMAN